MNSELYILWTTDNAITAEKMVCMYGHNALLKGWWDKVTIIIWGAASLLVAENKEIQKKILEMKSDGVKFSACIRCAAELDVVDEIDSLDIELIKWGEPLTDLIKSEKKLLTI